MAVACTQCGESTATEQSTAETASTSEEATPKSVYIRMSTESFREKLAAAEAPQLVDVRTSEEYDAGHIDGAVLMNIQGANFQDQIAELNKEVPVFVYCQAGGRSKRACGVLKDMGFSEIYELKDGYSSWK